MSGITSLFQYDFMVSAFIAVLIITPLFGILGTMIVNNKMAFFSDCAGTFSFDGNCGRSSIWNPGYESVHGDLRYCLCVIVKLDQKQEYSIHGYDHFRVFFLLVSPLVWQSCPVAETSVKYSSLLVGDILSITRREIVYLFLIFLATIVFGSCV